MKLKRGVKLNGVKPELLFGLVICDTKMAELGFECIVTSVCDGVHSSGSLHYAGYACDLRISHIKSEQPQFVAAVLSDSLGDEFDVVLEKDHIHLEFQPKK